MESRWIWEVESSMNFLDMENESSKTRAVARFLALGDFENGSNTVIMVWQCSSQKQRGQELKRRHKFTSDLTDQPSQNSLDIVSKPLDIGPPPMGETVIWPILKQHKLLPLYSSLFHSGTLASQVALTSLVNSKTAYCFCKSSFVVFCFFVN